MNTVRFTHPIVALAEQVLERAATQAAYFRLRVQHPLAKASTVLAYARGEYDGGESNFEQFQCGRERGHRWPRNAGEADRCLCVNCGADGDA
jgi:hypothetical protein